MRLEQLEYVRAVTEHGSLRRAGEHLHVSQPALSEAIGKLERELGVTLLDRHKTGTRINEHGRELLPRISEVLESVERLRSAARGEAEYHRPTRVGSVYFGVTAVVLPALRGHDAEHENTPLELRQLHRDAIESGLRAGTLDIGLVNLLPGDDVHPDLEATELVHGRPVAVVSGRHPLTAEPSVTIDQLRQEPFIGAHEGYLMHRVARRVFGAEAPLKWHIADGAEISKQMVGSNLGVSLMPEFAITGDPLVENGTLAVRPIRDEDTVIRMVLLRRRGARPTEASVALVEHLVRHGHELGRRT